MLCAAAAAAARGSRAISPQFCVTDSKASYITCQATAIYHHQRRTNSTSQTEAGPSRTPAYPLPQSKQASPYEVFHLSNTASPADIKARYYDLVKIYHPDRVLARFPDRTSTSAPTDSQSDTATIQSEKANEDFKRIREAYNLLSDDRRRRLFDRSGIGWDPHSGSGSDINFGFGGGPVWKGGFPSTPEEMAAYERWSSSLRRGGPGSMNRQGWEFRGQAGGHDRFGWQEYVGKKNNLGSDWFYGYGHSRGHLNANREPTYTTNSRFIFTLSFLTMILGIGQFLRLREESRVVVGLADRRHQSAAQSLNDARDFAKSEAGRARFEEMKRKAKERATLDGREFESEGWTPAAVGHGGNSGREAYEERMKRIGWSPDDN